MTITPSIPRTSACPVTGGAHDYGVGRTCYGCKQVRTPAEAIIGGISRLPDGYGAAGERLLKDYRAQVLNEIAALALDMAAALPDRSRETEAAQGALDTLAGKLSRMADDVTAGRTALTPPPFRAKEAAEQAAQSLTDRLAGDVVEPVSVRWTRLVTWTAGESGHPKVAVDCRTRSGLPVSLELDQDLAEALGVALLENEELVDGE
ncbi:hypothetical protein [Streptomyces chilikensis]|uniref:Uncharacterized protein n=1 Tax=Streptomyces chilikensis TaxID=1194079 RepID=A0ABV3EJC9_9ACTN